MLLEVSIEPQDLPIVFQPRRLHSRNIIIVRLAPLAVCEAELELPILHGVYEVLIVFLLQGAPFLLLRAINVRELLGFVEVLLVRISEYVAGQEWDLFGQVDLHVGYIIIYIGGLIGFKTETLLALRIPMV